MPRCPTEQREAAMLYSAEMRWFFEGDVPAAVDAWFREGADVESEVRAIAISSFPAATRSG
jgi:hypothetical protein